MVHGYHVIMPMHGFWLPNDPRGSWSDVVRKWELLRYGLATRQSERRTLEQLSPAERALRLAAKKALKYPPVSLTSEQVATVAAGFRDRVTKSQYELWACSILPEHTHVVFARHRFDAEKLAIQLKGAATRSVVNAHCHPLARFQKPGKRPPQMWAENQWIVFLDNELSIDEAIRYVEDNPVKEGLAKQEWPFVKPFTGLPSSGWITYLD